MSTQVRLLFDGEILSGFDAETVRRDLARRLKRDQAKLFSGQRVVVQEAMTPEAASSLQAELQALGALVHAEEVEALPPLDFLSLEPPTQPAQAQPSMVAVPLTDSGWHSLRETLAEEDQFRPTADAFSQPASVLGATDSPPLAVTTGFAAVPAPPVGFVTSPSVAGSSTSPTAPAPAPATNAAAHLAPIGLALSDAQAAPRNEISESALSINCPTCGERQPMRVLCRACGVDLKRALAAQQEEREAARAAPVNPAEPARGPRASPGAGKAAAAAVSGWRTLIPDHVLVWATSVQGLLALLALLFALAVFAMLWRAWGPAPTSPAPKAPSATSAPVNTPASVAEGQTMGPPPSEAEVLARLRTPVAVKGFRQSYWAVGGHKVFVSAGDGSWAWRGSMPSVTKAVAEALAECETHRNPQASECKVVNINGYWQE